MIINNRIRIKETIANIICDEKFYDGVLDEIRAERELLECYIQNDNNFLTSLKPVEINEQMPEIAKKMCSASAKVNVGPMAAVAGAISKFGIEKLMSYGGKFGIIDNGGDIALITGKEVTIGIYTGPAKIKNIGLKIKPYNSMLGICTSSGVIGHSLSFGKAHAVTVISADPLLADAAATAICNECKIKDAVLIEEVLNKYYIEGIRGVLVVFDDYFGAIGDIPEICESDVDYQLIAK